MKIEKAVMDKMINDEIKPKLRDLGFKGTLPHFRRIKESEVDLLTFQTDRNGGGFVIEIAKAKNEIFHTPWGEDIEPNRLTAHDLNKRLRIHPNGLIKDSSTENWFRYDNSKNENDGYKRVINQLIKNIELIESLLNLNIDEWIEFIEKENNA